MYDENAVIKVKEAAKISSSDGYKFRTIKLVCQCFSREKCPAQKSYFPMEHNRNLEDQYMMWCPKVAKFDDGIYRPADEEDGWINILDEPVKGEILEENINPSKNIVSENDQMDKLRICFMKSEIPNKEMHYIFRGIYKYKEQKEDGARIYKSVADEIIIEPFSEFYKNIV